MALKFKFQTKEEIPAELVSLYTEREGAWVLDVDGMVEKGKLDEFRSNNIALLKQLDEQKKRFEGIDPVEVQKLVEEKRKLEEAQQLCHFAGENQPRSCGSKPATPRCMSSYQFWFLHQALSLGGRPATGRAETG